MQFGGVQQPAAVQTSSAQSDAQQLSDIYDNVGGLSSSVNSMSSQTNSLSTSFYVLIGWVVIVTIALAVIVVITVRRWRQRHRDDTAGDDDISIGSSASATSYRGEGKAPRGPEGPQQATVLTNDEVGGTTGRAADASHITLRL